MTVIDKARKNDSASKNYRDWQRGHHWIEVLRMLARYVNQMKFSIGENKTPNFTSF